MLDYRKTDYEDLCIIALQGHLNALTAEQLRSMIQELVVSRRRYVVLDLSALELIDSSGVGALVSLFKKVKTYQGHVKMAALRGQPADIFRLLNLHKAFDVCPGVDDAVQEFLRTIPREQIPAGILEKWGVLLK